MLQRGKGEAFLLLMGRRAVHEISCVSSGRMVRWYFFISFDGRHGHMTCSSEWNEHRDVMWHWDRRLVRVGTQLSMSLYNYNSDW